MRYKYNLYYMQDDKLCFIIPCLSMGGQENAASVMANYFAQQHIRVTVITLYNRPHFYSLNKSIEIIDPPGDRSKGNKLWYYIKAVSYLRRNIKKKTTDRILSYGDWTNILVLMACIGLKRKVFISDRASPDLKFQWNIRILRRLLYPKAYGIIAQTDRAAQQKYGMLGNKINLEVIPNPVRKVQLFPEVKRENYVLGVGRHWPVKGLDRLIIAFTLLQNNRNYKLLIAGSKGPATKRLEEILFNNHLDPQEVFIYKVKEMDQLYAKCKIFVLPSRSEGFPNALIESMAAGLACISFDVSAGPKEIIRHGMDGFLVEDGNITALTRQIQYLIDNEEEIRNIGDNALKVKERLSLDRIGRRYLEFIMNS